MRQSLRLGGRDTMSDKRMVVTADAEGRVVLGPEFANSTLILIEVDPTEFLITKAPAVAEGDLWRLEDPELLSGVLEGLKEADRGEYEEDPPDFRADMEMARRTLRDAGFDVDS